VRVASIALGVAVLALAGCGGGDGSNVTASDLAACLRDQAGIESVSTAEDDLDAIAADAGDGGVYVEWPRNSANIAVERSSSDADNAEKGYEFFLDAFGTHADNLLDKSGNVVVLYDKDPTDQERGAVEDCRG
jgi:hypothetical protein